MLSVYYLVSRLQFGGPFIQMYNLITGMDRSEFEVVVVELSGGDVEAANAIERIGAELIQLKAGRLVGMLAAARKLRQLLSGRHCTVLHSHGFRPDFVASQYLRSYPRIATVHNNPYEDYPLKYGSLPGMALARYHVHHLDRLECAVACSNAVKDRLSSHVNVCATIQNGVDTETYRPATPQQRRRLRRSLGVPSEAWMITSVGSLSRRKDPEVVIRAFCECALGEQAELYLLGDGPEQGRCEKMVPYGKAGKIHLLGHTDRVEDYLCASDVFISASQAEGLPYSVLEALACGIPVVLSDIPPHRELVSGGRMPGALAPVGDVDRFARALEDISEASWSVLSKRARRIAVNSFQARQMSQEYQRLYRCFAK